MPIDLTATDVLLLIATAMSAAPLGYALVTIAVAYLRGRRP
jgi:hypothetical protein